MGLDGSTEVEQDADVWQANAVATPGTPPAAAPPPQPAATAAPPPQPAAAAATPPQPAAAAVHPAAVHPAAILPAVVEGVANDTRVLEVLQPAAQCPPRPDDGGSSTAWATDPMQSAAQPAEADDNMPMELQAAAASSPLHTARLPRSLRSGRHSTTPFARGSMPSSRSSHSSRGGSMIGSQRSVSGSLADIMEVVAPGSSSSSRRYSAAPQPAMRAAAAEQAAARNSGRGGSSQQQWAPVCSSECASPSEMPQAAAASAGTATGSSASDDSRPACVICLDAPRNVLLLPCKHLVLCESCAHDLQEAAAGAAAAGDRRRRLRRQRPLSGAAVPVTVVRVLWRTWFGRGGGSDSDTSSIASGVSTGALGGGGGSGCLSCPVCRVPVDEAMTVYT